ncbi:Dabb family protein [Luteolibacter pohnpeiensis]|uniref:Dabb family protein n=1 Tax=Luteolibacter pohnpeiensis TaxID=454153 RepID=A0A934S5N4_9BACT|nr:Dabb family protein [Luteolibacter pohnpeiensis]MBK1881624.1 Dabb family protein [Luteolibacter pohnpeiensis]
MDHHVYFWLKEENKNPADRAAFEQGLAALFEIEGIVSGRWAVPADVELRPVVDQSWDYALTMQFESVEKHDIYQNHPDHQNFISTFKELWAQVQVKDLA